MFSITLVNKVIFWRNKIPGVNSQVLPFLVPFHFMCFVPFKTSSLQLSLPKKAFRKKKPKYFNRREMCHVGPFFKTFLRAPTAKEHDIGWHKTRCINLRYSSARSSSFHKVTFWRVSQTLYEEIKLVCMHAILVFLLLFFVKMWADISYYIWLCNLDPHYTSAFQVFHGLVCGL